jgi:hypothetical protein
MSKSSLVRVVLVLSLAVVNLGLFVVPSSASMRGCYTCVAVEGGAMGWHPECRFGDEGEMSTCTAGLFECLGYPCHTHESAAAEIEVVPAELAAPAR